MNWLQKISQSKSMPLPFVPTGIPLGGIERIDNLMQPDAVTQVQTDYPNIEYLGSGIAGVAGYLGDRAVKITDDYEEAKMAMFLMKQHCPCIIKIFSVKQRQEERRHPAQSHLWTIEMEKATGLSQRQKDVTSDLNYNYNRSSYNKTTATTKAKAKEEFPDETEYIDEYFNMRECLTQYGIHTDDAHGYNIGYNKEGHLVLFDLGNSVIVKKSQSNWLQKTARPEYGFLGEAITAYRTVDLSRAEDVLKNGFKDNQYFTTEPDRAVFYANFTSEDHPGAIFECAIDSSRIEADMNDASTAQQTEDYDSLRKAADQIHSALENANINVDYHDIEYYLGSSVGADIGGYYDRQYHPSIWYGLAQVTGRPINEIRDVIPEGNYGNIHIDSRGGLGWTEIDSGQLTHTKGVPIENIHAVYLHTDLANKVGMQYEKFPNGMPKDGFQNYVNVIPYQRDGFNESIAEQLTQETDEDLIYELQSLSEQLDDDEAIIDGPMYRKLLQGEFLTLEDFDVQPGGFVQFKLPEQRMLAMLAIRKGTRWSLYGSRVLESTVKISKTLDTRNLHEILAKAIEYECGGKWEAGEPDSWTERLDNITQEYLGEEKGYSTSFWINCKEGDGYFHQKWGVSVSFTVMSGQSHTTFDSEKGDWDLVISANVQWASPKSWTAMTPYPLLIKTVGDKNNMQTIQEVADFVKMSIWNDQSDSGDEEEPEDDPTPTPEIGAPVAPVSPVPIPVPVLSSSNWLIKLSNRGIESQIIQMIKKLPGQWSLSSRIPIGDTEDIVGRQVYEVNLGFVGRGVKMPYDKFAAAVWIQIDSNVKVRRINPERGHSNVRLEVSVFAPMDRKDPGNSSLDLIGSTETELHTPAEIVEFILSAIEKDFGNGNDEAEDSLNPVDNPVLVKAMPEKPDKAPQVKIVSYIGDYMISVMIEGRPNMYRFYANPYQYKQVEQAIHHGAHGRALQVLRDLERIE